MYKLKSEIVNAILREKNSNPYISCRSLASKINSKFGILLSKSSVNSVFKSHNLSSPKGRPRKASFGIPEEIQNGCFYFFLILDYYFGISGTASEVLLEMSPAHSQLSKNDCQAVCQALLLSKIIFGTSIVSASIYNNTEIWKLIGKQPHKSIFDVIVNNFNNLQSLPSVYFDKLKFNSRPVFNYQFIAADKNSFYSDVKLFTFSRNIVQRKSPITYYIAKSYIQNLFLSKSLRKRMVKFFNLTGNLITSQETIDIFHFFRRDTSSLGLKKINLLDAENKIVDSLTPEKFSRRNFFIGFWPWQFENIYSFESKIFKRRIQNVNFGINFYYSVEPIEFPQPIDNNKVKGNIILLKNSPAGPVRMGILTNSDEKSIHNYLLDSDLLFWAFPEERFESFRKNLIDPGDLLLSKQFEVLLAVQSELEKSQSADFNHLLDLLAQFLVNCFKDYCIDEECRGWNWLKVKDVFLRQKIVLDRRKTVVICNILNNNNLCKESYLKRLCRIMNDLQVFDAENKSIILAFSRKNPV